MRQRSRTSHQNKEDGAATEKEHDEPARNEHRALYEMPRIRLQTSDRAKRTICVCVDDYGLHAGINQAALNLARENRISAVSCLVDGPAWSSGWKALKANAGKVEVGLHLNFTEDLGHNRILHNLPKLILLTYVHGLSRAVLMQDIRRQLERFEATTGRMPDFVDGHQHVHQLPVIRNALLEVLNDRYGSRKPWLRATHAPEHWPNIRLPFSVKFKSSLIGSLGATALSRLARKHGYSQNRHLLGVYGFDMSERRYLHNLRAWLKNAEHGDVLMCHPSLTGPWSDPLLGARCHEYRVLSGDAFPALAAWAGIEIGTLPTGTAAL
ncbi:MAG TPA: ChbG/HpnK family deacetylase [Thiobacillaceae bacterium]|nr:ChbG/HpnK family deacetylase [Thiobacillaceae bacterium]